jgi:hypothetical protein
VLFRSLLAGLLIYKMVQDQYDEKWAKRAFVLWFLNPLVILTGSMMGQFDVLPALMTLVALFFALRQRYLFTGLALGIGTLLKVYPVFLFIFFFSVIVLMNRRSSAPWITRAGAKHILALIGGGALSLLAILPFFITSGAFTEVILRRTDYQQFGGLSIWSIWNLFDPGSSPDISFPFLHVDLLIYAAIAAVAILSAFWVTKKRDVQGQDLQKRLVMGNLLFIASLLLFQPLTNPQHLLWLLPLLIMVIPGSRRMEMRMAGLTITGALFLVSILSFNAFLYPLASYTGLIDVGTLNQNIMLYYTSADPLPHTYVLGLVIFTGMVLLLTTFLPEKYDPMNYLRTRKKPEERP